jgi:hypothetical protein
MGYPVKGPADYFEPGAWNVTCSLSGFKRKSTQVVKNWMGYYRDPAFNEPRHPQDFVRGEQDIQTVPFSQPPTSTYISFCSTNDQCAIPGIGLPGCMKPGNKYYLPVQVP